jgi:hypothetical protein
MGETFLAEVVGVVEGVRQYSLNFEPNAAMYVPFAQIPARTVNLVGSRRAALPRVRCGDPIHDPAPRPLAAGRRSWPRASAWARSAAESRFRASPDRRVCRRCPRRSRRSGIYGVLAGLVAERRREIGVRVALAPERPRSSRSSVRESLRLGRRRARRSAPWRHSRSDGWCRGCCSASARGIP